MNIFGPPNIKKLKEKKDLQGLAKALEWRRDNWEWSAINQEAAEALGVIGGQVAANILANSLENFRGDPNIRISIIHALGNIADFRAISSLIKEARSTQRYGIAAEEALVKIGRRAAKQLLISIEDGNPVAGEIFRRIGCYPEVTPRTDELINDLSDINRFKHENAARILGEIGDPRAIEPLIRHLKDNSRAAEALGEFGDPQAVEPLLACLSSGSSPDMYREVTRALGKIGDPRAIKNLNELLDISFGDGWGSGGVSDAAKEAIALIKLKNPDQFG